MAPGALFAASLLTRRLAPDEPRPGPAALPALALSVAVVSFGVTVVANQLSRRIEARADSYSLRLTDAPEPFIGFERGIAVRNVADPDPPDWLVALHGDAPAHGRPHRDREGVRSRGALAGRSPGRATRLRWAPAVRRTRAGS